MIRCGMYTFDPNEVIATGKGYSEHRVYVKGMPNKNGKPPMITVLASQSDFSRFEKELSEWKSRASISNTE